MQPKLGLILPFLDPFQLLKEHQAVLIHYHEDEEGYEDGEEREKEEEKGW